MLSEATTGSQPDYIVKAASRRLSVAAYVMFGMFVLLSVLYNFVWPGGGNALAWRISSALIVLSLVVAIRVPRCTKQSIVYTATLYEVLLCLGIESMMLLAGETGGLNKQVSWSAVLIVFFPMLVAAKPPVILLGACLAASMGPVAYLGCRLFGIVESRELSILTSHWLPQFMAAALAYIPAKVIHQLSSDVKSYGSYELVSRLSEGGMGQIWKARHRLLARPAAIKFIRAEADSATLRKRFEREAQVTASLESAHTVRLYDFGISESGTFYYVMELLNGVTLEALVERAGPLPPERVVHLVLQVCHSLQEAHDQGLIHRDIKPANLFVTRQASTFDWVKVLDFGLVKQAGTLQDAGRTDLTATAEGNIVGTPAYLPPELAVGEQVVDGRADLYALGCVAYFLLTGNLVFESDSPIKMLVAHATERPLPLGGHPGVSIPPDLEEIVMNCLEKKVDDRPASARQLAQRLRATGLAEQWSSEAAELWWQQCMPQAFNASEESIPPALHKTAWLQPAFRKL